MGGAAELIANTYEQLVTDCRKQDDHEQEAQEVDGAQAPEARTPTRQAGPEHVVDWRAMAEDYDVIRDHASRVISGAEDFNTRVRDKYGFVLPPNPPRDERSFATDESRAQFTTRRLEYLISPAGHLILQTMRSHDQYDTTFYGLDDRYRGISGGRRVI